MLIENIARPVVDLYFYCGGGGGGIEHMASFCVTPVTGTPQSQLFKAQSVRGSVLFLLDGLCILF